jgi:hypothetical protein
VPKRRLQRYAYGALTLCGGTFQIPFATQQLCNSAERLMTLTFGPTTPYRQRHQALTPARFRLFPFRSPLLRESLLLSFPRGTEMFQFPRSPLPALYIQAGVPSFLATVGCPIRISTDQSLVGSSPWLFAATHVLHRLQAPRHPPLALVAWRTRCSCSLCNSQGALESSSQTKPAREYRMRLAQSCENAVSERAISWATDCEPRKRNRDRPTIMSGQAGGASTFDNLVLMTTE